MNDTQSLEARLGSGQLLHPLSHVPGLTDLSDALAFWLGVEGVAAGGRARALLDATGPADHLVLALADGFGMSFVEMMDGSAFVPGQVSMELRTVFPSSTPVALTSLATGAWPCQHAITGWDTYLPELGAVSTIIRFLKADDEQPLSRLGVTPEQAYPVSSRLGRAVGDSLCLFPENIVNSVYSSYWTGGMRQAGYKGLRSAIDAIISRVRSARQPTFTYIYVPHVDMIAHELGTGHTKTMARVRDVNSELGRLAKGLPERARLVMTADHGLLDASPEQTHHIEPSGPLAACLAREPSGDRRVMYFNVRQEATGDFQRLFRARFGELFALISTGDAERMRLLGPDPLSPATRSRLGSMVAVSMGADVLSYHTGKEKPGDKPKRSHHSGLSPAEMRVPLVVA